MAGVIVLSLAFLATPLLGYAIIAVNLPPRTKLILALVGAFVLIFVPVLVLLLAGGSGSS